MRAGDEVHKRKSAGAPFNVYLRNTAKNSSAIPLGPDNLNMFVATYAVGAGAALQEAYDASLFADGKYHIDVHGPNGFYREFFGDTSPAPMTVHCAYQRGTAGLTGNVEANVKNLSAKHLTIKVADNSYKAGEKTIKLAPGEQTTVPVESSKSHGWYDFTVSAKGSKMSVRYAGRVETGRSSFTDPLMGEAI
jgi:phospholipase C